MAVGDDRRALATARIAVSDPSVPTTILRYQPIGDALLF
jgi:hypothetical protein